MGDTMLLECSCCFVDKVCNNVARLGLYIVCVYLDIFACSYLDYCVCTCNVLVVCDVFWLFTISLIVSSVKSFVHDCSLVHCLSLCLTVLYYKLPSLHMIAVYI